VRHKFWTTGLRSCKVTISFYDCFVVAFAFTLVSLLPVCSKVRFSAPRAGLNAPVVVFCRLQSKSDV
jgi:hypothetical protein